MPSGSSELLPDRPFLRDGDVVTSICRTEEVVQVHVEVSRNLPVVFRQSRDRVTKAGSLDKTEAVTNLTRAQLFGTGGYCQGDN